MITKQQIEAIYSLYSNVVHTIGDAAYDVNGNEVSYDLTAVQAKLVELQAAEATAEATKLAANNSAIAKLKKLGLTDDEISALKGTL